MSIGRLDIGQEYMEICAINNVNTFGLFKSIVRAYFPFPQIYKEK